MWHIALTPQKSRCGCGSSRKLRGRCEIGGGGRGRREEAANRHGQWGREGLCKWGSPGGVAILLYFPLPCSHIHIHIFLFPACFLLQAFEAQNSLMGEELSRRTEVEVW